MDELFFNIVYRDEILPAELMRQVDQVTVEQEMGVAWEARIRIPLVVDEEGNWRDISLSDFSSPPRMRVEIKIGANDSIALIDGSLISVDSPRNSNPGQSYMTLVVQDDTYFLDREQITDTYDAQLPEQLAGTVFQECDSITNVQTDSSRPYIEDSPNRQISRRDTAIQFLQKLGRPIGFQAWVIPGEGLGQSTGCFRRVPVENASNKPSALVLTGRERNVLSLNFQDSSPASTRFRASTLVVASENVETTEAAENEELQGDQAAVPGSFRAVRLSSPDDVTPENQSSLTQSSSDASGYVYEASGETDLVCYKSVMFPCLAVDVSGSGAGMSGKYLIKKVTHELSRGSYRQSFVLARNAVSEASGSAGNTPGGEVA